MNPIAIQCANCGAKYKLPETFTAAKAKCKACGNQIDVAAARSAAPPAAAAAPAPAPVTRPAAAEKPAPSAKATAAPARERSAHASSRRAGKEAAAEETGTGRKSRSGRGEGKHHAPKKNNQMLLFAGIGGAVLVGAVLWFVLGGDKQAPAGPSPKVAQEPAKSQEPPKPADEPKADPEPAAKTPPDKPAPAPAEKPVAATEKPQEAAAQKPEKPKPAPAKKLTSKDEVYNPAKELQPLTYEDSVTDDQKKEVEDLVASIVEGGMPGIRAKKSVVKIGHRALPAIINRLREVNYLDSSQAMTAWELNKLLEEMALGVNAGYRQVMDGEAEDLDKSDWNAKTVKQWQNFYNVQYPTAEKWKELIAKRKNRNVEDSKKPDDGDKG